MKKFGLLFYWLFSILSNTLIILLLGWNSILFWVGLILIFRFLFTSMYNDLHASLKSHVLEKDRSKGSILSDTQLNNAASLAVLLLLIFSPIAVLLTLSFPKKGQ